MYFPALDTKKCLGLFYGRCDMSPSQLQADTEQLKSSHIAETQHFFKIIQFILFYHHQQVFVPATAGLSGKIEDNRY